MPPRVPSIVVLVLAALVLVVLVAAVEGARAADWPRWRGPGGTGVSSETGFPASWSAGGGGSPEKNVAWKTELPGWGNSSPVIVGERIYLTSQAGDDSLLVLSLDRGSGAVLWTKTAGKGKLKAHELHNMATPTCVAEADRVWALFGTGDLVSLTAGGDLVWRRDLRADHGDYKILWGMGSSPVIHGDLLFVVCMHPGSSYVLALDKRTGKDAWKVERSPPCEGEATDSYSTPLIVEASGRAELVVAGADHVNAYEPLSGKELWITSGLKIPVEYGRTIASPTWAGGVVFAPSSNFGNRGHLIAVRAGGKGDVSASHRLWREDDVNTDCPTPLHHDGLLYVVRDDGVGHALDARTGEVRWKKRLLRGDVKSSPVAADGKVYFTGVDGETVAVKAGPEGEVLGTSDAGGTVIATPALSGGRVFVRTRERLYAFAER
jgi:outer membrane protein assembly factor BamB